LEARIASAICFSSPAMRAVIVWQAKHSIFWRAKTSRWTPCENAFIGVAGRSVFHPHCWFKSCVRQLGSASTARAAAIAAPTSARRRAAATTYRRRRPGCSVVSSRRRSPPIRDLR